MNRSTIFLFILVFTFIGFISCSHPTQVNPNAHDLFNPLNRSQKHIGHSSSQIEGNMISGKAGDCGTPVISSVTNPFVSNSLLQPIAVTWTAGANNSSFSVSIKNTSTGIITNFTNVTSTFTTPNQFSSGILYEVTVFATCNGGVLPSTTMGIIMTGGPVTPVSDNLDGGIYIGGANLSTYTLPLIPGVTSTLCSINGNSKSAIVTFSSPTSCGAKFNILSTDPMPQYGYYLAMIKLSGSGPYTCGSATQGYWNVSEINYQPGTESDKLLRIASNLGGTYKVKLIPRTATNNVTPTGFTFGGSPTSCN